MMVATDFTAALFWLEILGIAVFAASGALTASRKQMDLGGFVLIATVTAIGGGTLRDLLVGARPVFWVVDPVYPLTCAGIAVLIFFTAPLFESRFRALLWADAVGLALFCTTGTAKAIEAGVPATGAVFMGVITAAFGGIARDVLCNEIPLILRREIYATAALAGAATYAGIASAGFSTMIATAAGFAVCFLIRSVGLARGLSLPIYDKRPSRTYEQAASLLRSNKND